MKGVYATIWSLRKENRILKESIDRKLRDAFMSGYIYAQAGGPYKASTDVKERAYEQWKESQL